VVVATGVATALAMVVAGVTTADEFWVSDRVNNRVIALDAANGSFLRVIAETGLSQPTSLTEGPGGLIYVANGSLGDPEAPVSPVVVVDPNGLPGSNVASFDLGSASTEEAPLFPGGILYDPTTNSLLVSEFGQFNGNRVLRFAMSGGDPVETLGVGSSDSGRTAMEIHNGQLYVSAFGEFFAPPHPLAGLPVGSVLRHDGGGLSTYAAGVGQSQTVLLGANGLDFMGDGSALYVASTVGQGIVRYAITEGAAGSPQAFGEPIAYPSGVLVTDQGGRESLIVTSLGNDNPQDPIYQGFLFPGGIVRYDLATGNKVSFLVGDFNGDLTVDVGDLDAWRAAAADSGAADFNGDGNSNGEDFLAWQKNYGNQGVLGAFQPTAIIRHTPALAAGAVVPEPATIVSALSAMALIGRGRRESMGA